MLHAMPIIINILVVCQAPSPVHKTNSCHRTATSLTGVIIIIVITEPTHRPHPPSDASPVLHCHRLPLPVSALQRDDGQCQVHAAVREANSAESRRLRQRSTPSKHCAAAARLVPQHDAAPYRWYGQKRSDRHNAILL